MTRAASPHRRVRSAGTATLIVAVLAAGGYAAWRWSQDPLDRAVRLGGLQSPWRARATAFWWLTADQALAACDQGRTWRLLRIDTSTGAFTSVPDVLSRRLMQGIERPALVEASPDGRRLLCHWLNLRSAMTSIRSGFSTQPVWSSAVVAIDGSSTQPLSPGDQTDAWLPDSTGWIAYDGGLYRTALTSAGGTETRRVGKADLIQGAPMVITRDWSLISCSWQAVMPGGPNGRLGITLQRTRIGSSSAAWVPGLVSWVPLPTGGTLHELTVSPDGRRILWLLESAAPDWRQRFPRFVQRILGLSGRQRHWEIWTTDAAGVATARLGRLTSGLRGRPSEFSWSPDGGRVSFVFRDQVWIVSVPPAR